MEVGRTRRMLIVGYRDVRRAPIEEQPKRICKQQLLACYYIPDRQELTLSLPNQITDFTLSEMTGEVGASDYRACAYWSELVSGIEPVRAE